MKYLKNYKIFEKYVEKILYHGGLEGFYDEETKKNIFNKFKKFAPTTAFFAAEPKFAKEYAEQKTTEGGYDADIWLYTCRFKGNIFEYDNPEDMNKLINLLPEEVMVSSPTGMGWAMIKKRDMIKNLQGIYIEKPIQKFVDAKIGDILTDPAYDGWKLIVVDKDDKYVYTIRKDNFISYRDSSALGWNEHWSYLTEYKDIFEPWRNAIVDAYNKNTGSHYSYPKYGSFKDFYQTYQWSKGKFKMNYVNRSSKVEVTFTEEDHKRIDALYEECLKKFTERAFKELSRTEWVLHEEETPMGTNFNYYETDEIQNIIKNLGYDGYVALENKVKTYAIFQPDKTVEIIETTRIR